MKPSPYTEEEKLKISEEAKNSGNIAATAQRYNISDGTVHGWMRKYDIKKSKNKNNNQFDRAEFKRLKKQLADKDLEISILKDLVKKTLQVWSSDEKSLMNTSPSALLKAKF